MYRVHVLLNMGKKPSVNSYLSNIILNVVFSALQALS